MEIGKIRIKNIEIRTWDTELKEYRITQYGDLGRESVSIKISEDELYKLVGELLMTAVNNKLDRVKVD